MNDEAAVVPAASTQSLGAGADVVTSERRRLVAELRAFGWPMRRIAREKGIPYATVRADCIAADLRREREVQAYLAGETLRRIADRESVTFATVRNDLQRTGVPRRRAAPPRKYPEPGERACTWCGKAFRPKAVQVAAGYGKFCCLSHAYLDRWHRTGYGIPDRLGTPFNNAKRLAKSPAAFARRFKGTWAGRKPPSAGERES